jgi:hypothetical protein
LWKEVREAMRRGTLGRIKRQRTAGELAKCRASKGTSVIRQSQLSQCVVTNLEEGEPKLGKHGKPTISGAVSTYIVLRGRGEGREDEVAHPVHVGSCFIWRLRIRESV